MRYLVEELLLREHDGGLRVGHQDKHIAVQTMFVNPLVKVCLDINARTINDYNLLSQQSTSLNWPMHLEI